MKGLEMQEKVQAYYSSFEKEKKCWLLSVHFYFTSKCEN